MLGHLASNGDCLFATAVARQIKEDFPGCHLTWGIGERYAAVIRNNPYVDEIWAFKADDYFFTGWIKFKREALGLKQKGLFDEIYFTQIIPDNLANFSGIIRPSIFRNYPGLISAPYQPVIRLSNDEISRVHKFAEENSLRNYKNLILFECTPQSNQSFVNPDFAIEVSKLLTTVFSDLAVIISTHQKIPYTNSQIIDGSILSFRENAELTNYCTLFVGCSSGLSWLATSDWAKPLNKVQLLSSGSQMFASMIADFKALSLPVESVLEMDECSAETVAKCISTILEHGFSMARHQFNREITNSFKQYNHILSYLFQQFKFRQAFSVYRLHKEAFGRKKELKAILSLTLTKTIFLFPFVLLRYVIRFLYVMIKTG